MTRGTTTDRRATPEPAAHPSDVGSRQVVGGVVAALAFWLRVIDAVAAATFIVTRLPVLRGALPVGVTTGSVITVYLLSTALVVLRACVPGPRRLTWALFATGLASYSCAIVYSWLVTASGQTLPFPSPADVGWLAFYPCAYVGLFLVIRSQVAPPRTRLLLDGLVTGVGAAAVLSALTIGVLISPAGAEDILTVVIADCYPVGDALLLGLVLCLFTVAGPGSRRDFALLMASFVAFTAGDTGYIALASRGQYRPGDAVDCLYVLAVALLAAAVWRTPGPTRSRPRDSVPVTLPIVFSSSSLALLVVATQHDSSPIPIAFAGITLVAVVIRTLVSFRQITRLALHDGLTGLPNRALVADRLDQMLFRSGQRGTSAAVLFIDLDGFKNINDTLGHDAGDQLLRSVAARLAACLRGSDTIGRMGGDEFVVLVDCGDAPGRAELIAERLIAVLRQPFELDLAAAPIVVTTSVGVAVGDGHTAGELLRDADVALYQAKAAGKNCHAVFHSGMQSDVLRQYELEFDLRSALSNGEFRLVYQPIHDLATGSLSGAEALLRWDHPRYGVVEPDAFIPLLESTGAIVDVGRWVLQQACGQLRTWTDAGHDLTVAVNVSARQLDRDDFVGHVASALADGGVDASRLAVEITETALMRDVEASAARLRAVKELGIKIAIDDFGSGYSSLAHLKRFPVDCLKIDRSFTTAITSSPESDVLMRTLVQLGRDLGLATLAEGVETGGQLDQLRRESVGFGQGFLLSHPLTPEEFEEAFGSRRTAGRAVDGRGESASCPM